MKTILILLSAFELFSFSALADVFNGVFADTNNMILPGFTLPYDQISGAVNLTTNYALLADFNFATNHIATNSVTKAFPAVIVASNTTTTVVFSAPYFLSTNYSVGIFPQDGATAATSRSGQNWWADTRATNGFTLHSTYSTNAFNMNFDVIVRANTQ